MSSRVPKDAEHYLRLGDALLERGWICRAVAAWGRAVDSLIAERLLIRAGEEASSEPRRALRTLQRVEGLVGASREGRLLLAKAYRALGEDQVARRFSLAAGTSG